MMDPILYPVMWFRFVSAFPGKFRKAVQSAERMDFHAIEFPEKPVADECIICQLCGVTCKGSNEFYGHVATIHGHRNPFKLRVQGSQCLSCLKNYFNREKLCHHLKHSSKKCARYYMARVPILPPDVLKAEDAATAALTAKLKASGRDHKYAELPP